MSAGAPIPDDLLLIMQSYVDPPVPDKPPPATTRRQQPVVERIAVSEGGDDDHSEEDEVEVAIRVEVDDEDPTLLGAKPRVHTPEVRKTGSDSGSDSDSDSDSDSSDSSDVELRVTDYPTKAKQRAPSGGHDLDIDDDEDAPSGSLTQYSGTKNEVLIPEVRTPELTTVPLEDELELIGEVMTIIDSVVVIKGHTSGVHRVLDTDSLLVFDDRKVLGAVFETFGAVKQPLYSIRFSSASAIDKNLTYIGRPVYHVPSRSNYVFTQEIARIKGSDASNLHDEEVGEDQMEFSDDEAEAQWRRNRKEAKRSQMPSTSNPPSNTTPRQAKLELPTLLPYPAADDGDVPYSALPYDDVADPRPAPAAYDPYSDHEEEFKAPATSHSTQSSPRMNRHGGEPGASRGGNERGRGRGSGQNRRGRPDERGRPKRGRGGRGRGRGDRRQGRGGGGFFPDHSDQYPDPSSTFYGAGQYPFPSHDEGYSPVDSGNGNWEQNGGTMPHINPRFFSGEMQIGADPSAAFGMQWNGMPGYNFGLQQSSGYGGYDQGNDGGYTQGNSGGYNQNYGASYWGPNGQSYPSQSYPPPRGQN